MRFFVQLAVAVAAETARARRENFMAGDERDSAAIESWGKGNAVYGRRP